MNLQRCADIPAGAHLSTLPTEGPTTCCCGPWVGAQRGTDEIHLTQTAHPNPDSSQLSCHLYYQYLKTLQTFLAQLFPFSDSRFPLQHTPTKSPLQHPTCRTC